MELVFIVFSPPFGPKSTLRNWIAQDMLQRRIDSAFRGHLLKSDWILLLKSNLNG
jgi:hypothetical protein